MYVYNNILKSYNNDLVVEFDDEHIHRSLDIQHANTVFTRKKERQREKGLLDKQEEERETLKGK